MRTWLQVVERAHQLYHGQNIKHLSLDVFVFGRPRIQSEHGVLGDEVAGRLNIFFVRAVAIGHQKHGRADTRYKDGDFDEAAGRVGWGRCMRAEADCALFARTRLDRFHPQKSASTAASSMQKDRHSWQGRRQRFCRRRVRVARRRARAMLIPARFLHHPECLLKQMCCVLQPGDAWR